MNDLKLNFNVFRKKSLLKVGVSENIYGVLLGYLRVYVKKIGIYYDLVFKFMYILNIDVMLFVVMLFDVFKLSVKEVYDVLGIIIFD